MPNLNMVYMGEMRIFVQVNKSKCFESHLSYIRPTKSRNFLQESKLFRLFSNILSSFAIRIG